MKKVWMLCLMCALLLSACTTPQPAAPTIVLETPSAAPATQVPPPTLPLPTAIPPAAETPTSVPVDPTQAVDPTLPPVETFPLTTADGTLKIFLVAPNDNGQSGKMIGCQDSVVPVQIEPAPPGQDPLKAALEHLLAIHDQMIGESGLYTALYDNTLQVSNISIDGNGVAIIELTGELLLGGTCDDPRVEAQLEETALQFEQIKEVHFLLNGQPLENYLGGA